MYTTLDFFFKYRIVGAFASLVHVQMELLFFNFVFGVSVWTRHKEPFRNNSGLFCAGPLSLHVLKTKTTIEQFLIVFLYPSGFILILLPINFDCVQK